MKDTKIPRIPRMSNNRQNIKEKKENEKLKIHTLREETKIGPKTRFQCFLRISKVIEVNMWLLKLLKVA